MRILWFETSVPCRYNPDKNPTMGWQDALQDIVMGRPEVELAIAFENPGYGEIREIDNVTYFPINTTYSWWERQRNKAGWEIVIEKTMDKALEIVNSYKPDIIHVFGSEWCFGLLAERTDIPVVVHMQGSMPPYNNALLPPLYSVFDLVVGMGFNLHTQFNAWLYRKKDSSRQAMEEKILKRVRYYMGRTDWDRNLVNLFHPGCKYFYCSEALRSSILQTDMPWQPPHNRTFRIVTTGISSFWKGIDTILRTAHLLKERGFDFEWICAGSMGKLNKKIVEHKEKMCYEENNVKIAGFLNSDQLQELLLSADLYVHTAYIDNSPNAVCEAQYLGLPIIATYVGGIPSLIDNGKDGILIPANAPYTLTSVILDLSQNESRRVDMGKSSRAKALERHRPENIVHDLFHCYKSILR